MSSGPRRQIDLSVVRPRDLELTFGRGDDGRPIHPDPDDPGEPRWFCVRGRFSADEMLEMLAIAEQVEHVRSDGAFTEEDAKKLLFAANDVGKLLTTLIGERYQDVVLPPLELEQAMMLLQILVGNPAGPAGAVQEALDAGAPEMPEAERAELVDEIMEKLERGETFDPPTQSDSGSSLRSSTSVTSTGGAPSGGPGAAGALSAPISSAPTAV